MLVLTEPRRSQILRTISLVLFHGSPGCYLEASLSCSGWAPERPPLPWFLVQEAGLLR